MKIPTNEMATERILPESDEAYIENPFPGKRLLTTSEAIDAINRLSGMVLIDRRYRIEQRISDSNKKYL